MTSPINLLDQNELLASYYARKNNIQFITSIYKNLLNNQNMSIKEAIELTYQNPAFETVTKKIIQANEQWVIYQLLHQIELDVQMKLQLHYLQEVEFQRYMNELIILKQQEELAIQLKNNTEILDHEKQLLLLQQQLLIEINLLINYLTKLIQFYQQLIDEHIQQLSIIVEKQNEIQKEIEEINQEMIQLVDKALDSIPQTENIEVILPEFTHHEKLEFTKQNTPVPTTLNIENTTIIHAAKTLMIEKAKNGEPDILMTDHEKKLAYTTAIKDEIDKKIPISLSQDTMARVIDISMQQFHEKVFPTLTFDKTIEANLVLSFNKLHERSIKLTIQNGEFEIEKNNIHGNIQEIKHTLRDLKQDLKSATSLQSLLNSKSNLQNIDQNQQDLFDAIQNLQTNIPLRHPENLLDQTLLNQKSPNKTDEPSIHSIHHNNHASLFNSINSTTLFAKRKAANNAEFKLNITAEKTTSNDPVFDPPPQTPDPSPKPTDTDPKPLPPQNDPVFPTRRRRK